MNLTAAESLAYTLMDEHGLFKNGWSFQWDNAKRRLGHCRYRRQQISLSREFVQLNAEDKVRNTILHEIAHALLGIGYGHGRIWKLKAIEVGAIPEACSNTASLVMPVGKFRAACRCTVHYMHRKPKNKYRCRTCKQTLTFEVSQ